MVNVNSGVKKCNMGQLLCLYWKETVSLNGVRYDVIKSIGEGAFSFVQLVKRGSDSYALKRVLIQVPEHKEMINREIKTHQSIKHSHVMPLVDYEIVQNSNGSEARLLFPYHKLGSVQEMIEVSKITKKPIPEVEILSMFKSLCSAVHAFHSHDPPMAHRDIKPHNLLIAENSTAMLMDLGSCREAVVRINSRQEALALQELAAQDCTAAFRAPELFEVPSECIINQNTDIWSLGCTLYALAYGDSPCDGTALSAVSPKIKTDDTRYSDHFNKLIVDILKNDSVERPSALEIIEMINEINNERK